MSRPKITDLKIANATYSQAYASYDLTGTLDGKAAKITIYDEVLDGRFENVVVQKGDDVYYVNICDEDLILCPVDLQKVSKMIDAFNHGLWKDLEKTRGHLLNTRAFGQKVNLPGFKVRDFDNDGNADQLESTSQGAKVLINDCGHQSGKGSNPQIIQSLKWFDMFAVPGKQINPHTPILD